MRIAAILIFLLVTNNIFAMPIIVAHRGSSKEAPENSPAAFKLAWLQGADAIEGDFRLTSNNEVVCIHDKDTKRVSGTKIVVKRRTLAELKKIDIGQAETIPTLEEILNITPSNKFLVAEIKSDKTIVPYFLKVLNAREIKPEQVMIICFDMDVLIEIKRLKPQYKTMLLIKFKRRFLKWTPSVEHLIQLVKENGLDGASVPLAKCLNKQFVDQFKAEGLELHCYTIDKEKQARYLAEIGINSITTNIPLKIKEALD